MPSQPVRLYQGDTECVCVCVCVCVCQQDI